MSHTHSESVVAVFGNTSPAKVVDYIGPQFPGDSGFTVLLEDAPAGEAVKEGDVQAWHLCCLIDEHPTVGRGLDACLASETKCVELDEDGEWVEIEAPAG